MKNIIAGILTVFLINSFGQNLVPITMPEDGGQDASIRKVWYAPTKTVGEVGKYKKLELGFRLENDIEREVENFVTKRANGINPFDPEQINVSIKLTAPDGTVKNTHAFYYLPYFQDMFNNKWIPDTTSFKWRLRFAPDQLGSWKGDVQVTIKEDTIANTTFDFSCMASDHKGVLKTSKTGTLADRYLYLSETGETFIPIGHNITTRGENITPLKNELHKKWITELGTNGGNFFRMEMPAGGALPDWPTYNDYSEKLGKMYGYDDVVSTAEALEMYFIMFRHHVEVGKQASWGVNWDCWANNSYKKGLNLRISTEYFTNEEAIKWQKNSLRYIMARWGYSPSFAFYGYSEVDLWVEETGMDEGKSFDMFADWFIEMKKHINSNLHFLSGKYICSFRSSREFSTLKHPHPASRVLDESDVISLHTYSYRKYDNYRRFGYVGSFIKEWDNKKPVLLEETGIAGNQGIFCCTGLNFHNTIWASSFSGTMGSGLNWNWDRGIHSQGYYIKYRNLKAFFENEDFRKTNYTSQRWKNDGTKSMKNATLENYALVSENKEKVLGWVHNSTFYWRNMFSSNPCIKELLDSNGVLRSPCQNADKSPALGTNPHGYTYNNKEFTDKYSLTQGAIEIVNHPKFKISGLKGNGNRVYNPFAKKHWYEISYYSTHGEICREPVFSNTLSTNAIGRLKPKVPELTNENPDYSYKVKYLGKYRKKEGIENE